MSNYCQQCLDEALNETPNGVITEVNLAEVTRSEHICIRCGHAYCLDHASPVDLQNQCLRCLPLESIATEEKPLIGDDGVTHRGRQLIPVGPNYRTLPHAISIMTDTELEEFIKTTAEIVHTTEKIQEYRRIGLSTARLEKADRADAKLREARAIQAALPRSQRVTITGKKGNGTASTSVLDFIKFAQENLAKIRAQKTSGASPAPVIGATSVQSPPKGEAPETERDKEIKDLLGGDE